MHDLTSSDRASHLVIQGLITEDQAHTERIRALTELLSVALEQLHVARANLIKARAAAKAARLDLQRYTEGMVTP